MTDQTTFWREECERLAEENRRMREAGGFLLDRLVDHEVRMTSDEDAREWCAHVTPAMARFRSALASHAARLIDGEA
jgi:hypothetical protein